MEELGTALEDQYDIRRDISRQVMAWFGAIVGGEWSMDRIAVVREIGLGILRPYRVRRVPRPTFHLRTDTHIASHLKDDTLPLDDFLTKWRRSVGDTFEADVSLDLLSVSPLFPPALFSET